MPLTKLEIFKIKISNDSKFTLDKTAQDKINLFLAEENNIYVNHSTSVISEGIEEYGNTKTIDRFLVISLIYRDLNTSDYDLKNTITKVKATVTKEIENGISIKTPIIETEFDKEILQLTKVISSKGDSGKDKVDVFKKESDNKTIN
jgi:hypothetical protein